MNNNVQETMLTTKNDFVSVAPVRNNSTRKRAKIGMFAEISRTLISGGFAVLTTTAVFVALLVMHALQVEPNEQMVISLLLGGMIFIATCGVLMLVAGILLAIRVDLDYAKLLAEDHIYRGYSADEKTYDDGLLKTKKPDQQTHTKILTLREIFSNRDNQPLERN